MVCKRNQHQIGSVLIRWLLTFIPLTQDVEYHYVGPNEANTVR